MDGFSGHQGDPLYSVWWTLHTGAAPGCSPTIDSIRSSVPAALSEAIALGRTLRKRADDGLDYVDRPATARAAEAINGRLQHLRGYAHGVSDLTNYIARILLETGGLRSQLHP